MNHVIVIGIIVLAYTFSSWVIRKYVTKDEIMNFVFSFVFVTLVINIFGAFLYYFGG